MTRTDLSDWALENDTELLFLDPQETFDSAIVGLGRRFNSYFVIYDQRRVIENLMVVDGMTEEDACEHFNYNVIGGWVGDATPAFIYADAGQ